MFFILAFYHREIDESIECRAASAKVQKMAAAKLKKKKGQNASKRASVAAWLFFTKSYSSDVELAQTDDSSANSETGVEQPAFFLRLYRNIRSLFKPKSAPAKKVIILPLGNRGKRENIIFNQNFQTPNGKTKEHGTLFVCFVPPFWK